MPLIGSAPQAFSACAGAQVGFVGPPGLSRPGLMTKARTPPCASAQTKVGLFHLFGISPVSRAGLSRGRKEVDGVDWDTVVSPTQS